MNSASSRSFYRYLKLCGLTIAVVLSIATVSLCQQSEIVQERKYGTVSGTIINRTTQKAVIHALVKINSTASDELTDINGRFEISSVPEGVYTLHLSWWLECDALQDTEITAIRVRPGDTTTLSLLIEVRECEATPEAKPAQGEDSLACVFHTQSTRNLLVDLHPEAWATANLDLAKGIFAYYVQQPPSTQDIDFSNKYGLSLREYRQDSCQFMIVYNRTVLDHLRDKHGDSVRSYLDSLNVSRAKER